MTDLFAKEGPRLILALAVAIAFAYAVGWHWSASLEATVINIAMIVIGYHFGSSKGSTDKAEQIQQMQADNAEGGK